MLISFFIIYKIFKVGQVREGYLLQCRWEIFKGENFYNEVITLPIAIGYRIWQEYCFLTQGWTGLRGHR